MVHLFLGRPSCWFQKIPIWFALSAKSSHLILAWVLGWSGWVNLLYLYSEEQNSLLWIASTVDNRKLGDGVNKTSPGTIVSRDFCLSMNYNQMLPSLEVVATGKKYSIWLNPGYMRIDSEMRAWHVLSSARIESTIGLVRQVLEKLVVTKCKQRN